MRLYHRHSKFYETLIMKYIIVSFWLFINFQLSLAQNTFVKEIDLNNHSTDNSFSISLFENNLIIFSKSCDGNCISIAKLQNSDSIEYYKEINVRISEDPYILDNDTIIIFGDNDNNDIYSKLIHKQTLDGQLIYEKEWNDPLNRVIAIDHEGSIQFGNKYISIGSFFDKTQYEQGKYKTKGYISFINRGGTLDTFVVFDNFQYVRFRDVAIDSKGNLTLLANIIDSTLTEGYQECLWIIKLDENKNIMWDWKSNGQLSNPDPGLLLTTADNKVIVQNYQKRSGSSFAQTVELLNIDKEIEWKQLIPSSLNNRYIAKMDENQDNIQIVGRFTEQYILPTFYNSEISKIDGNLKWDRKYINYHDKEKEIQITPQSTGLINNFVNLNGNKRILLGSKSLNYFSEDSTIKRDNNLILIQTDSFGCVNLDKCNDYYAWGDVPDSLFQYDQIDMKQKEWYYSIINSNNITETKHLTFGKDSILFDRLWGDRQYKEVLVSDENKNNTIVDTFYVRWENTGQLYFIDKWFPKDGVVSPADSILYDFSLKIEDNFLLPKKFGFATVSQIDSIVLIDGYYRKRITLKHDNPTSQNKFGDLIWIEGIGSLNGLFYFYDWINGTKTSINCYYDRDKKRYGESEECSETVISMEAVKYVSASNEWVNFYNHPLEPKPPYGERYTFSTDSVKWNDKYYFRQLVSKSEFDNDYKENRRIFREDNNKIFEGLDVAPGEALIYDFNLNVGDTVRVLAGSVMRNMVCTKVDTVIFLDGNIRKRQEMLCIDSGNKYVWIEGFGEKNLYREYCEEEDEAGYVSCYYYNKTLSYSNSTGNGCWPVGTNELEQNSIRVSPNPTNGALKIESNLNIEKVKVYDLYGQFIKVEKMKNSVDLSNLANGVYILEIIIVR